MPGYADIERAAEWLSGPLDPPHPLVPYLRETFDLSALEAVTAIRRAIIMRREKTERAIAAARFRQGKRGVRLL